MSSVNYNLGNRGVRLIPANKAWIISKNGSKRLNPKYKYVGKIDTHMSNMVISAIDGKKPKFKGNTLDLNRKFTEDEKLAFKLGKIQASLNKDCRVRDSFENGKKSSDKLQSKKKPLY